MTATDYLAIAGLLAGFVALPGAVIGVSLRGLHKELARMDERLLNVEQHKVSHAEWVRVTVSHNNRMDRVSEQLAELSGKMDATFGIPAGLTRIAAALEQHTEPK
jgi:hypothetical protein